MIPTNNKETKLIDNLQFNDHFVIFLVFIDQFH